jgi:hypothetical protein
MNYFVEHGSPFSDPTIKPRLVMAHRTVPDAVLVCLSDGTEHGFVLSSGGGALSRIEEADNPKEPTGWCEEGTDVIMPGLSGAPVRLQFKWRTEQRQYEVWFDNVCVQCEGRSGLWVVLDPDDGNKVFLSGTDTGIVGDAFLLEVQLSDGAVLARHSGLLYPVRNVFRLPDGGLLCAGPLPGAPAQVPYVVGGSENLHRGLKHICVAATYDRRTRRVVLLCHLPGFERVRYITEVGTDLRHYVFESASALCVSGGHLMAYSDTAYQVVELV